MATMHESCYYGSIVLPNSAGFLAMLTQHSEVVGGIKGLVLYYRHKQQWIHTYCMHESNTATYAVICITFTPMQNHKNIKPSTYPNSNLANQRVIML